MGELTKVKMIDGRIIENKSESQLLKMLQAEFKKSTENEGEIIVT
jgi:hypothetical protein